VKYSWSDIKKSIVVYNIAKNIKIIEMIKNKCFIVSFKHCLKLWLQAVMRKTVDMLAGLIIAIYILGIRVEVKFLHLNIRVEAKLR